MRIMKAASAMFCMAATAMVFAPPVSAQKDGNQKDSAQKRDTRYNNSQGPTSYWRTTTVTFSGPVEIPGVHQKGFRVLPAGTYVFSLLDSQTNRHIVQIQNKDRSKTFATIMAIPNTRVQRSNKTVITFDERPNGQPPALRAWFYPNAGWGEEFVYSKSEAQQLAKANNTPVLYSNDENASSDQAGQSSNSQTASAANESFGAYNAKGEDEPLNNVVTAPTESELTASNSDSNNNNASNENNNNAQAAAVPTPTQNYQSNSNNELAQSTPPANSAPAPVASSNSNGTSNQSSASTKELPQTAGDSGMFMLGGVFALLGALSVRFVRSHA